MKGKTNAPVDVEATDKAIVKPEAPISDEKVAVDAVEVFDVRPSETVSIVAGNRVLFLGEGLKEIRIAR